MIVSLHDRLGILLPSSCHSEEKLWNPSIQKSQPGCGTQFFFVTLSNTLKLGRACCNFEHGICNEQQNVSQWKGNSFYVAHATPIDKCKVILAPSFFFGKELLGTFNVSCKYFLWKPYEWITTTVVYPTRCLYVSSNVCNCTDSECKLVYYIHVCVGSQ